jgi:peptidoglycan/LPS O-acetylase OafA/YrhL
VGSDERTNRASPGIQAPEEIPALTSLRFFAAIAVVLYHFGPPIVGLAHDTAERIAVQSTAVGHLVSGLFAPFGWVVRWGYLGVSWFFVLSGFILTHVYAGPARPAQIDRRRFWVARFARVYPGFFLGFLLSTPLFIQGEWDRYDSRGALLHTLAAGVPAVLCVHSWLAAWVPVWNFPSWSVAVEAFFYAVFPALAPSLRARRPQRRLLIGATAWLAGMTVPALYLIFSPDGLPFAAMRESGGSAATPWLLGLKYFPLFHLHELVIGIIAGLFYGERDRSRDARMADRLVLIGTTLVLLATAGVNGAVPYPLLHDGFLAPAFALVIYGFGCGGRLAPMLSNSNLVLLGEASYAVYILQMPVGDIVTIAVELLRPDLTEPPYGPALTATMVVVVLVGFSVGVLRFYESPLRRRLVKLARPRAVSAAPAPA